MKKHSENIGMSNPKKIIVTGGASKNKTFTKIIANVFGEPELPADAKVTVTIPLTASSIKSKFVLVVSPQVPLWVPVSIFSIPKLVVYVLGIYAALLQSGDCSGSISVHVGL